MHDAKCFLTLTYSEEHLPENYSVDVRTVQLFLKRLRKWSPNKLRFFACGEYGETNLRPHYHALIFGEDFANDRYIWRKAPSGHVLYRSEALERLWPFGNCEIGSVTEQSAGYLARYCTKKVTGDRAANHYTRVHPVTGVVWNVAPEFATMSRRPGIGAEWFDAYAVDAFPSDFVTIDGRKRPVPSYYTGKLDDRASLLAKGARKLKSHVHADNNTPERLSVRERVQLAKTEFLQRNLDNES